MCTSSFSSSGSPHLEANRERERKEKTAVGTKRQTSFSKCPTTRNSAPRVSKRARTSATPSHEAKLERQPELQPGRYTTRTPQEGRSWPVARLSQEHRLTIISIRLLTPAFFFSRTATAAHQQRTGTTQQHATAPAANRRHEEPETARTANTLPTPKPLARHSRSLASLPRATRLCCSRDIFEMVIQL